ncbi:MAG: hypothetical protein E7628_01110 [Ruminococcaceae bacterium]|nr:hypothetical protein [Oscillospiraceae bacterium]
MDNHRFELIKYKKTTVEEIFLEYSLLKSKYILSCNTVYSVRVDATQNGVTEYKLAFDITRKLKTAKQIFDILVNGNVTPCTMFDVLEDIL